MLFCFWDGKVLFMPRGSSSNTTMVLGVRESNLYRLKGQPMRAMANSSRVTMNREQVALKVVQTQREPDFRGSQQIQRDSTSEGVNRLRGRVNHSEGVNLQVGERSLPRLSGRCHGLRKPGRKLRSGRLLGATCLPGGTMPYNRTCFGDFGDRGSNQSGGLECSCGSRSSAGGRATSSMGDKDTSR
jgi:hypothetical protein